MGSYRFGILFFVKWESCSGLSWENRLWELYLVEIVEFLVVLFLVALMINVEKGFEGKREARRENMVEEG